MKFDYILSERIKCVAPSGIRAFFDLASTKKDVISLGVGEPDFITPWSIREAAIYSIESGKTYYTANLGLIELRKEISLYLKRRFDVAYRQSDEILVTVGGSEAIDLCMRSIINPGDEVIVLEPSYVAYVPSITLSGGKTVSIELQKDNHFKLTKDMLLAAITPQTKAILLNYPSNPTGGCMTREDYKQIIPILKESGIIVISDEIYAEISYEQPFCSLASFDEIKDQVVLISGFSKAFAMTGWRLGYVCAHPILIDAMNKVHQYTIMSAPIASQYGAIEALKHCVGDVVKMKDAYLLRRNYLVKAFNDMGLETFCPQGAFYVFPCIQSTGYTSMEFCQKLLDEYNVACVPGTAFGSAGEGFIRVSYAYSLEQLKAAVIKIEQFVLKDKS